MTTPERLREWMRSVGASQTGFAAAVGTTRASVAAWLDGETVPSLLSAVAVERVTGGAVPAEAWVTPINQEVPCAHE